MSASAFVGMFHWIAADENGWVVPFESSKMSAFAYVEPRLHEEGALLIHGIPNLDVDGVVEARWLPGYPIPETSPGDVVTVIGSQRPIATIKVTETRPSDTDT